MADQQQATFLADPAAVDLSRSAVIEASAGTGKTYTIEHLVVRLMKEEKATVDNLLVVTFTEKATGELRRRIRDQLTASLEQEDNRDLKQQLLRFDEAQIHTIHGFCHSLLAQYPFEARAAFNGEVTDDGVLLPELLQELLISDWPKRFGDTLEDLLTLTGFKPGGYYGGWVSLILDLAGRLRQSCGEWILPEVPKDFPRVVSNIFATLKKSFEQLAELLHPIDVQTLEQHPLCQAYDQWASTRYKPPKEKYYKGIILPLLEIVHDFHENAVPVLLFLRLLDQATLSPDFRKTNRFDAIWNIKVYTNQSPTSPSPLLEKVVSLLDKMLQQANPGRLKLMLQADTVHLLQEKLQAWKQERELVSYEDMLARVDQALLQPESRLKTVLQERFRYALVDEFQDTDQMQWRIFRTLFTGRKDARLFLVGDPKQAIYGFRGADVDTYLEARQEMLARHGAHLYSLECNWRSMPGLVEDCNTLFQAGEWFKNSGIQYLSARVPHARRTQLYRDESERAPVTIIDLEDPREKPASENKIKPPNIGFVQARLARFICTEINHLLNNGQPRLLISDGHTCRPLQADDICVLVRNRKESTHLERALTRKQIPYTFYKKGGLYQSDEALHLHLMLQALANPGDRSAVLKALLTPFLGVEVSRLPTFVENGIPWALTALLNHWEVLAAQAEWGPLFHSLLTDSHLPAWLAQQTHWERSLTNLRHLAQNLQQMAQTEHLDSTALVWRLDCLRRGSAITNDEALHRLETEQPRVQIMTMHASKGLEFPVVFVAGGFTGKSNYDYYTFRADQGKRYDLEKSEESKKEGKRYRDNEDRRLLYVALTRAMYRLYLPRLAPNSNRLGPVCQLLHDALEQALCAGLQATILDYRYTVLERGNRETCDTWSGSAHRETGATPTLPDPLFPGWGEDFMRRRRMLHSFTSLHHFLRHSQAAAPQIHISEQETTVAVVADEPQEAGHEPEERQAPVLPPGERTGSMLHLLLEELDFSEANQAADEDSFLGRPGIAARIDRQLQRFRLVKPDTLPEDPAFQAMRRECAGMLWRTLRTPFLPNGVCLARININDRLAEAEFLFAPKHNANHEGYLGGVMDLVFRHDDRYWLLDWKSNHLDSYDQPGMEQSMAEHNYTLQYRIYLLALITWLESRVPKFDFHQHFGGVFYLFLRGMDPDRPQQGVFRAPPLSLEDIRTLPRELAEQGVRL